MRLRTRPPLLTYLLTYSHEHMPMTAEMGRAAL